MRGVVRGVCVFYLHPVTPLSLKSDDSNFVQIYFRVGLILWGKKNREQIGNDVTMTSYFFLISVENSQKQPILKLLLLLYFIASY